MTHNTQTEIERSIQPITNARRLLHKVFLHLPSGSVLAAEIEENIKALELIENTAAQEQGGWCYDMDKAPEGIRLILGYVKQEYSTCAALYSNESRKWADNGVAELPYPDAWQRLPPPPQKDS